MSRLSVHSLHLFESKWMSSNCHIKEFSWTNSNVSWITLDLKWGDPIWIMELIRLNSNWMWLTIHSRCFEVLKVIPIIGIPINLLKQNCIKERQQTVTEPSRSRRGAVEEPSRSRRVTSGRVKQCRPDSMGVKETSSWPGSCQGTSSSSGKQL